MKKFIVVLFIVILWSAVFFQLFGKDYLEQKRTAQISAQSYTKGFKVSHNDTLRDKINQLIKQYNYNGSVYITYNNETVVDQSYGFKDAAQKEKFGKKSMYLIGSSQKLITGIITKQLVDSGKIDVNAAVQQYIPDFDLKQIKIKDLIIHRSGLVKYANTGHYHGLDASVAEINRNGFGPVPYGSYLYNDANYILLAKVIENVTHKTYQENVEARIFNKYHLKESGFFDDNNLRPFFVKGLTDVNNQWEEIEPFGLDKFVGAGNIYMSPKDMGVFLNYLMQNKVLNQQQLDDLFAPSIFNTDSNYRYGFYLKKGFYRTRGYFFGTDFVGLFNRNKVVVVATNKQKEKDIPNNEKLAREIFKLLK
ncbi:serine hydrolase domain-containing protein [Macrococcus capreoli]|uniref:serine hydrolase domain-containing protein n=1 Tax=Macrococcus capreoli TaxID=2982690 RepID=UPI0021D59827|nr:serine hydrolase domain-containing protein [Macrococcus sp. TMW 2.2395]MCU7556356.1 beta-lactamase family protein [Macrococcus sp. TMW 2.2395]